MDMDMVYYILASPSVRTVKKSCDVLGFAIDKFLSYEKLTADKAPCYPYNDMLEILVDAHQGKLTKSLIFIINAIGLICRFSESRRLWDFT